MLDKYPSWVYASSAGGRLLAKKAWEEGVKQRIPQHYKDFYQQWSIGPQEHIHSRPATARFEKDEWGEIAPIQNPRVYVVYPDEFHNGLWGGEGVIKGLLKRPDSRHRTFIPPQAKYWWPELFEGVVYSEILNKHIEFVMTKRGARLVDECKGLDHYLLQTPVNEVYAWRLLRIKRELLLELADRESFCASRRLSGGAAIYDKYAEFAVPHDQADWTGLTLREAVQKQVALDELEKENNTVPMKHKYRQELVDLLRSGYLDDLDLSLEEAEGKGGIFGTIKSAFSSSKK